jgi:hypothetical protein
VNASVFLKNSEKAKKERRKGENALTKLQKYATMRKNGVAL